MHMTTQPVEQAPGDQDLETHYETVVRNLLKGRVTPVLGAGASLYGRPHPPQTAPPPDAPAPNAALAPTIAGAPAGAPEPAVDGDSEGSAKRDEPPNWESAPTASELAAYLAREFNVKEASDDLLRVAQWVYAVKGGSGDLYEALHGVFDRDFPQTGLHDFLADVPGTLRSAARGKPPLIVTTNYDDLIERALDARQEPYDVLVYMAEGTNRGRFCRVTPEGEHTPIRAPERYLAVDPDRQTVVLKMHGYVSRRDPDGDSYVITEDHYIEYLSRTNLTKLLPKPVMARLLNTHLLFLGYSLRDWNFRAILYYIFNNRLVDNDWWSVQLRPDPLQGASWKRRNVEIINISLEQYIPALAGMFFAELNPPADSE
jgi:SIR2-like domain